MHFWKLVNASLSEFLINVNWAVIQAHTINDLVNNFFLKKYQNIKNVST